jgi:hypothetical protein
VLTPAPASGLPDCTIAVVKPGGGKRFASSHDAVRAPG